MLGIAPMRGGQVTSNPATAGRQPAIGRFLLPVEECTFALEQVNIYSKFQRQHIMKAYLCTLPTPHCHGLHLISRASTNSHLLCDMCVSVLQVLEDLQRDPWPCKQEERAQRCTGSALSGPCCVVCLWVNSLMCCNIFLYNLPSSGSWVVGKFRPKTRLKTDAFRCWSPHCWCWCNRQQTKNGEHSQS